MNAGDSQCETTHADVPRDGSVVILGLGPIGDMGTRVAQHRGVGTVIGVDLVEDRLRRAGDHGVTTIDLKAHSRDLVEVVRELTGGRGPDSVIDAVGMEAHGSPVGKLAHQMIAMLPDGMAQKLMTTAGTDRLAALHTAIELARRGGTISVSGVYGGSASPMPLLRMFDKQIQFRMGQANVHRWVPEILPLLENGSDPLGTLDFATHHLPLELAPQAYATFQNKEDGMIKTVLRPVTA